VFTYLALLPTVIIFCAICGYILMVPPTGDYEDNGILIIFSIVPSMLLGLLIAFLLFSVREVNCRQVVQIGGCNRYGCGVIMSNGAYEEMGEPVIGLQRCDKELEWRF
jgi:hypothetical protein